MCASPTECYCLRCDMYEDSDDAQEYSSAAAGDDDNHRSQQGGVTVMSRSNKKEAELVVKYTISLIEAGLKSHEIAVITPYNGQVDVVKSMFAELDKEKAHSIPVYGAIEVGV
jgi:hypothetical protein